MQIACTPTVYCQDICGDDGTRRFDIDVRHRKTTPKQLCDRVNGSALSLTRG
jgi:hypothetical protein